jgi:maltooligosyltrehalose synthase
MKTKWFLFPVILFLTAQVVIAQDSVNVQPQPSLPGGQYQRPKIGDSPQKEERVEVEKENLPPLMQKALREDEKYVGWENAAIYFEKNMDQYLMHLVKENTTQTFRFDKKGNPLITDQPAEAPENKH